MCVRQIQAILYTVVLYMPTKGMWLLENTKVGLSGTTTEGSGCATKKMLAGEKVNKSQPVSSCPESQAWGHRELEKWGGEDQELWPGKSNGLALCPAREELCPPSAIWIHISLCVCRNAEEKCWNGVMPEQYSHWLVFPFDYLYFLTVTYSFGFL
jgi:hypothetical protein